MKNERSAHAGVTARKPNGGLSSPLDPANPKLAFEAVQLGDSSSIVNLLHAGIHPDAIKTSNDATALTVSIINNNRILAEQLLAAGANPNLSADPSYLHLAVARSDNRHTLEILASLLRSGANPNRQEGQERRSALHQAIATGRFRAAKALLEGGADPNEPDGFGASPLSLALRQPVFLKQAFCCLLERHGANMSALANLRGPLADSLRLLAEPRPDSAGSERLAPEPAAMERQDGAALSAAPV